MLESHIPIGICIASPIRVLEAIDGLLHGTLIDEDCPSAIIRMESGSAVIAETGGGVEFSP